MAAHCLELPVPGPWGLPGRAFSAVVGSSSRWPGWESGWEQPPLCGWRCWRCAGLGHPPARALPAGLCPGGSGPGRPTPLALPPCPQFSPRGAPYPSTCCPLAWTCRKAAGVSHSGFLPPPFPGRVFLSAPRSRERWRPDFLSPCETASRERRSVGSGRHQGLWKGCPWHLPVFRVHSMPDTGPRTWCLLKLKTAPGGSSGSHSRPASEETEAQGPPCPARLLRVASSRARLAPGLLSLPSPSAPCLFSGGDWAALGQRCSVCPVPGLRPRRPHGIALHFSKGLDSFC